MFLTIWDPGRMGSWALAWLKSTARSESRACPFGMHFRMGLQQLHWEQDHPK